MTIRLPYGPTTGRGCRRCASDVLVRVTEARDEAEQGDRTAPVPAARARALASGPAAFGFTEQAA